MPPKLWIKTCLAFAASLSGALSLIAFHRLRENAFVMMYHRVLRAAAEEPMFVQPGMYVSCCTLQRHIAYLKKKFSILSLSDLIGRVESGRNIGGCCAITFDDGWRDNFVNAFPILKDYQAPATIFLSTGFIGTSRSFWPEEIGFYLQQPGIGAWAGPTSNWERLQREMGAYRKGDLMFDRTIEVLKDWTPADRHELLSGLRSRCPAIPAERMLMNWDEVLEMQASGLIHFGAHTVNHVILDQVPEKKAEEEISRSRQDIEDHMGVRTEFFAYPNGNFNSLLQVILKRQGIRAAVTTRKGLFGKGASLLAIPRIGMHEDVSRSVPLFRARVLLERF